MMQAHDAEIEVTTLVPRTRAWRLWTTLHLDEASGVLARSYGARNKGRYLHLVRVHRSEPYLVFAKVAAEDRIVGFFYIHRDGKHGAIGVDPLYQGRGIGGALLSTGLELVPAQWAEVLVSDDHYPRLLKRAGFELLESEQDVAGLLGPLLVPLVSRYAPIAGHLAYYRASFSGSPPGAWYRLFSIGTPAPRLTNDGRYYMIPFPPEEVNGRRQPARPEKS